MKVAILGWGSLIWAPGTLNIHPHWHHDGPTLPIEFSRVSGLSKKSPAPYLSLVVDPENGTGVTVMYALSREETIDAAVADLAKREMKDPKKIEAIGNVSAHDKPNALELEHVRRIREWAQAKGFDGTVWTALTSNFQDEVGKPFAYAAALEYLESRPPAQAGIPWRYIARAPATTETGFRAFLREAYPTPPIGNRAYPDLEAHLRYAFRDQSLLTQALTHETFVNENRSTGRQNNERLAFVGDAVIELVVRRRLFERTPSFTLDEMNVEADKIVENDGGLSEMARAIGIDERLIFGSGEQPDKLRENLELQATGFEAVIGALYKDAGPHRTFEIVGRLLDERDTRRVSDK